MGLLVARKLAVPPRASKTWLACLAWVCAACSVVVDFPDHPPRLDAGVDSGDASPDVRDVGPDAPFQSCTNNAACDSDQLCCMVSNQMQCVDTNVQRCSACNVGCDSPSAPNCGERACECAPGSNKGCDNGQTCDTSSSPAHCVECAGDNDCASAAGKPFCEGNKCVACKRGAMADSSADDVGCSGRTPICGPDSSCIGCDDSSPATACTSPLVCSPGLGCGGCKVDASNVKVNGCPAGTPVCKTNGDRTECAGCTANLDCKLPEGQGYCVRSSGQCTNKCDPGAGVGANGCAQPSAPFCKAASNVEGGVDCVACSAADCTNGTFCATGGAKAGSCVVCRNDADCNPAGVAPVCDATTFTCRARTMTDCVAPTPYLSTAGTCVACVNDTQCTGGQHCSPTTNTCVACADSSQCPLATPTCNPTTNTCVAGCTPGLCQASHNNAKCNTAMTQCVECLASSDCTAAVAKPICDTTTNTCVACTTDAPCMAKTAGYTCITAAGACGNCATPGLSFCGLGKTCGANYICQ